MPAPTTKAVFYDPTRRRFRLYIWVSRLLLIVFTCSLSFTLWSVFHQAKIPNITLSGTTPPRSVANIPAKAISGTIVPIPTALAEQRLKTVQKDAPTNQIPKRWGFFVNWDDNSFSSLKKNINSLDGIMPEWLHLVSASGTVVSDDLRRQTEVETYLRATRPDLTIVPLVNNYSPTAQDWDSVALAGMLADPTARATTIASLLAFVQRGGYAGISIDFENVPDASQSNLVAFMRELSTAFRADRRIVVQNIPLNDDSFDAKVLGQYADQLIVMAYDEHVLRNDSAGSVAGQPWYEQSLITRLGELPANKYIIALGGYGYDWTDGGVNGSEVSFQDAMRLARGAGARVALDPTTLNPTFDYTASDGIVHHVWYLDAVTVFNQIAAAAPYHPGGYALWRLGSEDPRDWLVFNAGVRGMPDASLAEALRTMPYGYDLDYEGRGEVLRVTGAPQTGRSECAYDASRGRIVQESITAFPSGYVITRYGGGDGKQIALTFDDGPDPTYTPRILSILEQYHVPATFFTVGLNVSQHPDIVRRIITGGSDIGSHTFSHPDISRIGLAQLRLELNSFQRLLESRFAQSTVWFRPPYAEDVEPETPEHIVPLLTTSRLGYYTVAMHIDPNDWDQPGTSAETIARRVIDGAKNGDGNIVLLHDGGGDRAQTVAALPRIIAELQAAGFQLVTVSDLVGADRAPTPLPLSFVDRIILAANDLSFSAMGWFGSFIRWTFTAGIALGIGRLLFVITLALIQKTKSNAAVRHKFGEGFQLAVSVIVPAYNERQVILQTIGSILQSDYPRFDIIIVDDGSTDGTSEVVRTHFGDHASIRLLTRNNQGKSAALNFGIRQTEAPIIVTLDADTQFRPDTISKLVRHFARPEVGAVAGNAKVGNRVNILTKWQALEYIVSQNLDRRALELLNAITVVPGSVGAWRREAILRAGGFSSRTLAEDADLTFGIIRRGYRVAYEDAALGFTEAPGTVGAFVRQRFRWMYGTMQTVYRHGFLLLNFRRGGGLGWVAMPNIIVFQILFPLISPFIDLALIGSITWGAIQRFQHPVDYTTSFTPLLEFYALFTIIDIGVAVIAFLLERRREQMSLIAWLPLQRFFYRQIMYYVAWKTVVTVIKGRFVRWGHQDRRANVSLQEV
jgi:cellulose synthase/poly-beta-1,6-N-acetylglucosamine synthase-like glycosyltransferase/peptidoglycan/xylan/chitin deacetylase (PgdA/CDA1 family)/spore germination protein YaaH